VCSGSPTRICADEIEHDAGPSPRMIRFESTRLGLARVRHRRCAGRAGKPDLRGGTMLHDVSMPA
jgi:hypothetical protein